MPLTTPPTAPTHHTEPAQALAQVQRLYQQQIDHLRAAMQRFVAGDLLHEPVRAFYPFVRVHTTTVARADSTLAYGFVEGPPGRYETTLTRPDLFANYYLEQFRLLRKNHGVELEVGVSTHPIPIHFSFAEHDHIEGTLSPERRMLMRDLFDLPDLAAMDDGIANGTWQAKPGEAQPLSLFTAPRVDYSLHRCSPTTSSTSTNLCAWGTLKWPIRTANTLPLSSPATSSRADTAWQCRTATSWVCRRRACRKCRPTTWCAPTRVASRW